MLVEDMQWLTGKSAASEADAGYLSNYDEMATKDALPDETYRRNAIALTIFLAKAGFNILLYVRDLLEFSGELTPEVGGATERNEGKVYITHRLLTQEEFELRLKYSLEELVKNSFTYKFIESFKNKVITFSRMEGSKVIFSLKGRGGIECVGVQQEIYFNLINMTYEDVTLTKRDLSAIGTQVSSAIVQASFSEYSLHREKRGQALKLETNLDGLLSQPVKEQKNKVGVIQDSRPDPNTTNTRKADMYSAKLEMPNQEGLERGKLIPIARHLSGEGDGIVVVNQDSKSEKVVIDLENVYGYYPHNGPRFIKNPDKIKIVTSDGSGYEIADNKLNLGLAPYGYVIASFEKTVSSALDVLSSEDIYRIALNTSKEGFKWAGGVLSRYLWNF